MEISKSSEKLDLETMSRLIKETEQDISKVAENYKLKRANIAEISNDLLATAKKVKFDKKYQNTLEYLAFLFARLDGLYADDESFAISMLMQQNNNLVNAVHITMLQQIVNTLIKLIPEGSKEIRQIREELKQYDEIMQEVKVAIKKKREETNTQAKLDEERTKANVERLKRLEGGTYT